MQTSTFFRLFPPPKFMVMRHAGLDISDDAIHCLSYGGSAARPTIAAHASLNLPPGLIDGGEIKDENKLRELLVELNRKINSPYVSVSLPEEKAYLFETDVPGTDVRAVAQNIEFKLEENVPLSAADAVFYFDLLPRSVTGGALRASVSVVPRAHIEGYIGLLRGAGFFPVSFEVVPKAIARAIVPAGSLETILIIHLFNRKTGVYVVSGGVVCFTSTMTGAGAENDDWNSYADAVSKEIDRVCAYWATRGSGVASIGRVIMVGRDAARLEKTLGQALLAAELPVSTADPWSNIFSLDRYIPPISREDSFEYTVAAGLAMDS